MTCVEFYEWLKQVKAAAEKASDPGLLPAERRRGDREIMKLTTPRQLLYVVSFITAWFPEETFQRLQKENS